MDKRKKFKVAVFSDLHHGEGDYNDFKCTLGLKKLQKIIDETRNCDFYINLGDAVDNLNGGDRLYREYEDKLKENGIISYFKDKKVNNGERFCLNLLGNHETAYMHKKDLAKFLPYKSGVGSVYSYNYNNTLFLAIDALFSAETKKDDCESILKTQPPKNFFIPRKVIEWASGEVKNALDNISGIVLLSHVSLGGIEEKSVSLLFERLIKFNLPITAFLGHAHAEDYARIFSEDNSKKLVEIFTLPAVTTNYNYDYYVVTFSGGKAQKIEKRLNFEI